MRREFAVPIATTAFVAVLTAVGGVPMAAQNAAAAPRAVSAAHAATAVPLPSFVLGPNDVLTVNFWGEKEMSTDVVVRPDGNITLPLLNDIHAAGLTPDQLREIIATQAKRFIETPSPTVIVKEIHSRKVFITGQVEKPGPYPLTGSMTVIQLIATAGGMKEFADGKNILVMRTENGNQIAHRVDYQQLLKRKNLGQNIELKPGDTVVVP